MVGPILLRRVRGRAFLALALASLAGAGSIALRLDDSGVALDVPARDRVVSGKPCGKSPFSGGLVLCDPHEVVAGTTGVDSGPLPARLLISAAAQSDSARALARMVSARSVRARVRLRPIVGRRNPGGRDMSLALSRRGIGARGYLVDPDLVVAIGPGDKGLRSRMRRATVGLDAVRARIRERLVEEGAGGGLLAALAVGDRTGLSVATRTELARLGIVHLLAVSGLHVAMVVGLSFALLRRAWAGPLNRAGIADPRVYAAAAAFGAALAYAGLAGFGVPLQRALIVAAVGVTAFASGRTWPTANVLAVAVVAVLVLDPGALFDAGPQLSFAAAAALMLAPRRHSAALGRSRLVRIQDALRGSLRTTSIAVAGTAPLLVLHGMATGVFGLVLNLIAVPVTGVLLLPAALVAAVLAAWAPSDLAGPAIAWLSLPAEVALGAAIDLARVLPPDPPSVAPTPGAWMVGVAVAAAAIRAEREGLRVILVVALVLWLRTAPVPVIDPLPPRLVALDVGQGDAMLIQGRTGAILIDAGRAIPGRVDMGARVVVPALAALGVVSLDVVVATHRDADHRGGLVTVIRRIPVGALWIPIGGLLDPAFEALIGAARDRRVPIEEVAAEASVRRVGDLRVELLWPSASFAIRSANDRSIVVRVSVEGDAVLVTGDISHQIEDQLLERGAPLRARILKVAHHGSDGSSSGAFLEAVGARVAIVSAACGARSGLPTASVLARLHSSHARVAWTGREGAVSIAMGADRHEPTMRSFGISRDSCGGPAFLPGDGGGL